MNAHQCLIFISAVQNIFMVPAHASRTSDTGCVCEPCQVPEVLRNGLSHVLTLCPKVSLSVTVSVSSNFAWLDAGDEDCAEAERGGE